MSYAIFRELIFIFSLSIISVANAFESIEIVDAWVREVPPVSNVTAVYMKIQNNGKEDDSLLEVKSSVSKSAEVHTTSIDERGIVRMKRTYALEVPAGKNIELNPGGTHIMLIDLNKPLKKGEKINLDLTFKNLGTKTIEVEVKDR
ncbi:copper chaperone PCu(A)C [Desulfobacterota bacterium AH_259_B03_O07]|nr:copper chaperone PCu(A)C [Desulfobacterota bacterium AH_259_B03_O07]